MLEQALTVTKLNTYIKNTLEMDRLLSSVWVKGEISNLKLHSSGHIYLTLKDEGGVLKSVMFRSSAAKLVFLPENGMKIIAHGRVSVYERDGQYQLYIDKMEPDGTGALYIAFEQLKNKLRDEGLFDEETKKSIPQFPEKIGVVTSPTGAAVRDIINVLTRRYPVADICVYPVLVQGDGASEQIAAAISYINKNKTCDVIIAGRGGGSLEELWAFNEETTARAIFESEIPVISAVGHETDFTIADFVADLRAPTPSAAAELAVPDIADIKSALKSYSNRMNYSVTNRLDVLRKTTEFYKNKISINSILNKYNQYRIYIDSNEKQLYSFAMRNIEKNRKNLSELAVKLDAFNPLNVLTRGYAAVSDKSGKIVTSAKQLSKDDMINIRFSDGTVNASVREEQKQ